MVTTSTPAAARAAAGDAMMDRLPPQLVGGDEEQAHRASVRPRPGTLLRMGEYVNTPQGPMHEVDFGGTGPNLILIHGLGGSTTNWNAVAPALTVLGHVRAIDLPGFGLTPPRSDFRLDTHRDSVVGYLEKTGGPFTLIGNSTGGLLAELIASARPDLVERLILVSPATPPVVPDPRLDWPTAARLAIQATPGIGEAYGRRFIRTNTPEQLVRKSMNMITHKPGRVPMSLIEESREMARIRKQLPWAEYADGTDGNIDREALFATARVRGDDPLHRVADPGRAGGLGPHRLAHCGRMALCHPARLGSGPPRRHRAHPSNGRPAPLPRRRPPLAHASRRPGGGGVEPPGGRTHLR